MRAGDPQSVAIIKEEAEESESLNQKTLYQPKSIYHPDSNSISYTTLTRFPPVKLLPSSQRKRVLVTGGAGFVGSHLVDRLMLLGHEVTVIDNFFTGSKTTVSHWVGHPNFELVRHDVVEPFMIECDRRSLVTWSSALLTLVRFRNLSSGLSCLSSSLPIQCHKDRQNVLHGISQYAWACKTDESSLLD